MSVLGWLRRVLGGGPGPEPPEIASAAPAPPSSSVPPPPKVREQLEEAHERLKETIPSPEDDREA